MMSITDSSRAPTPQRGPSTTPLPTFTRRLDFFGPNAPSPPPRLDAISFDYFDEVWVAVRTFIGEDRREGFVVLRLSEGGHKQQRHIVSRS